MPAEIQASMKLKIEQVNFSYNGFEDILKDISFDINTGQIICILGPNGIGKTTLLTCLARLNTPDKGRILLNGQDLNYMEPRIIAQNIGYVPQTIAPSFDYSVLDYVVTGLAPWLGIFQKPEEEHYKQAEQALQKIGIEYLKDKPYTCISAGELQMVSIARVLAQKVQFVLMDEPTSHLDFGNQLKVLNIIKEMAEEGYGIALTTHNPDQVLLLEGKVAVFDRERKFHFGEWTDILTEELLKSIYGVTLNICEVEQVSRKVCIAPRIE